MIHIPAHEFPLIITFVSSFSRQCRISKTICAIGVTRPRPCSIATLRLTITTWNRLSWPVATRLGNEAKIIKLRQISMRKSYLSFCFFSILFLFCFSRYLSGSSDYEKASSSSYFRPSSLRSSDSSSFESPIYDVRHSMYLSSRSRDSESYKGTIGLLF